MDMDAYRAVRNPPLLRGGSYGPLPTTTWELNMSKEIKAALRATMKAITANLENDGSSPELQTLIQKAIKAAEKVAGTEEASTQTRKRGPG